MASTNKDPASPKAADFGEALKPSPVNVHHGGQVGDNWPPENEHEPRDLGLAETNPLGDGEDETRKVGVDATGEEPVNVGAGLTRFAETQKHLKPDTARQYVVAFRRFANDAHLETLTRRQASGAKGKALILSHLQKLPRPS